MKRSALPLVWGAWAGCAVADAERAAGDGVDAGAVGRAVVGHHALHGDAVASDRTRWRGEEADRGGGFLVGEDFGVGQAGGIVDGDVHGSQPPFRERPARRCTAAV